MPPEVEQGGRAEVVFGLVGATGTPIEEVSGTLSNVLKELGYRPAAIRLSEAISQTELYHPPVEPRTEDERIEAAMNAGDAIRAKLERNDAVALLGIRGIRKARQELAKNSDALGCDFAFIVRSLKTPEEVTFFRNVYRESFFLISIFASDDTRKTTLAKRIAESHRSLDAEVYTQAASQLMARDQQGRAENYAYTKQRYGQNVQDAFPLADFFVNAEDEREIYPQLKRFVEIVFNHPNRTPTADEYVMFHAKAAALRSADLSRQVGAVIATPQGEIVSTGCNEVPLGGGGSIWEGQDRQASLENRDFALGHDSAALHRDRLLMELLEKIPRDWLSEEQASKSLEEQMNFLLYDGDSPPMKKSQIASLLEYGRMVHAEMSAITEAARRGRPIHGAKLYCTTFPCHMCARHIISAGISEVFFIEPYEKSAAKRLYEKDIALVNEPKQHDGAVTFRPFLGVSPSRYVELFEMPEKRKDKRGRAIQWSPATAEPKAALSPLVMFLAEDFVIKEHASHYEELGTPEWEDEDEEDTHDHQTPSEQG